MQHYKNGVLNTVFFICGNPRIKFRDESLALSLYWLTAVNKTLLPASP